MVVLLKSSYLELDGARWQEVEKRNSSQVMGLVEYGGSSQNMAVFRPLVILVS